MEEDEEEEGGRGNVGEIRTRMCNPLSVQIRCSKAMNCARLQHFLALISR